MSTHPERSDYNKPAMTATVMKAKRDARARFQRRWHRRMHIHCY